jgi:AcrR family transcriptional regulator
VAAKKDEKAYHHGDLRRGLLDAAAQILAAEGAAAVTLREVARRAGVTHAAPYRHFADKGALLSAIAAEGFDKLTARMQDLAAPHAPGTLEALRGTGVGYVQFACDNPSLFRLMFGHQLLAPGESSKEHAPEGAPRAAVDAALAQSGAAAFEVLTAALAACQASGVIGPADPQALVTTTWALVHGLSMLLIDEQVPHLGLARGNAAEIAARVIAVLEVGIAAR